MSCINTTSNLLDEQVGVIAVEVQYSHVQQCNLVHFMHWEETMGDIRGSALKVDKLLQ